MRSIISAVFFLSFCTLATGQGISKTEWYSEVNTNGITIQNSFPRSAPYTWETKNNFNFGHLVFFTRVVNETEIPLELTINFSADSISIPHLPDTFMKLFLPSNTMTYDKLTLSDYGVTNVQSLNKPTSFQRIIKPKEECLFNVVAIFYQNRAMAQNKKREGNIGGGNRAELVLKGEKLFYRMLPQIDLLPCGEITIKR